MTWTERTDAHGKYLISEDGKHKITNEGKKGGNRYCRWGLHRWHGPGGTHEGFVRLLAMGTLEDCKNHRE